MSPLLLLLLLLLPASLLLIVLVDDDDDRDAGADPAVEDDDDDRRLTPVPLLELRGSGGIDAVLLDDPAGAVPSEQTIFVNNGTYSPQSSPMS